jgi:hypothetical protein
MLTPDIDTYVIVTEADAYFDFRYGYDKWAGLTEPVKEQLLRSAVQKLDFLCTWNGELCSDSQPLAFPRKEQDCDTPQQVKDAQCEIAYLMLSAGSVSAVPENPLKSLKAGSAELEWFDRVAPVDPLTSGIVMDLLGPYGTCLSSGGSTSFIPIERN